MITTTEHSKHLKVAILSPSATVVPHFETELDIAQQHLDAGDLVMILNCLGGLKNCDHNIERTEDRCRQCIGRREMGLELLTPSGSGASLTTNSFSSDCHSGIRLDFESLDDLIAYQIDDFDIGYAALSSLVSICRDPEPDLVAYRDTLNRFLVSAGQTYQQTLDFLRLNAIDRVYVFNGRFAAMRGVLRACQRMNVDCYLHERGCDGQHFELCKNHLPHDITAIETVINEYWDMAEANPDRQSIAASWFHDRVNRVEKVWHSFVKDQQQGRLPNDWNPDRKNVSFFCSSDDEFIAIGGAWLNDLYPSQPEAISRIAADLLQREPDTQLYVRVHPNVRDVDNQRKRETLAIDFPNVTIIPPEAEIDTYELMRQSDLVATFGSSVGIEATFWDKPSVLLGPCFYRNLGGVYGSSSHEQTIDLLTQTLDPLDKTGALKYGFWFQTRGFRHQYFTATDLFEGNFKDQTLYARSPKLNPLSRLKKNAKRALASLIPHKQ